MKRKISSSFWMFSKNWKNTRIDKGLWLKTTTIMQEIEVLFLPVQIGLGQETGLKKLLKWLTKLLNTKKSYLLEGCPGFERISSDQLFRCNKILWWQISNLANNKWGIDLLTPTITFQNQSIKSWFHGCNYNTEMMYFYIYDFYNIIQRIKNFTSAEFSLKDAVIVPENL